MPFDTTGFRVLTEQEEVDLAVLRKVREAIRRPGAWKQNEIGYNGSHCLSGWFSMIEPLREMEMMAMLEKFMRPRTSGSLDPSDARDRVVRFNDRKSTRQSTVVHLLDKAIAKIVEG